MRVAYLIRRNSSSVTLSPNLQGLDFPLAIVFELRFGIFIGYPFAPLYISAGAPLESSAVIGNPSLGLRVGIDIMHMVP